MLSAAPSFAWQWSRVGALFCMSLNVYMFLLLNCSVFMQFLQLNIWPIDPYLLHAATTHRVDYVLSYCNYKGLRQL